jgi:hypothetical protein
VNTIGMVVVDALAASIELSLRDQARPPNFVDPQLRAVLQSALDRRPNKSLTAFSVCGVRIRFREQIPSACS